MLDFTKVFRPYAKYRYSKINSQDLKGTQSRVLLNLVSKAKNTKFGKDHNFSQIKSVEDFQKNVPLRKYEDFWDNYWQKDFPLLNDCTWPGLIPFFCLSSGTTSGSTKYIPYTYEMINSNSKAGLDLMVYHSINRPNSKIFGGKSFVLGGSTELQQLAPGVMGGDLSGIAAMTLPWWAKYFYFPPKELALIKNWEEKIDLFAMKSTAEDIRSISGVPSWMLILIQKMKEVTGKKSLSEIFPNLEMLVHGGVNFAPYFKQFNDLLKDTHCELREVYPASEGFIAIGDLSYGEGLRLNIDHDIFFEFVPIEELSKPNPVRHSADKIELNLNYAVVMTTAAGLWSYIIGDTVKFISRSPARLLVTGRTSYFISAFGEHLTGEEVEKAVAKAAQSINKNVTDYSLGAVFPAKDKDLGGHLLIIEFGDSDNNAELKAQFKDVFVSSLCELNEDYAAHYANGYGLNAPEIRTTPKGTFINWMKKRGKLGGQNKVPRIISNQDLFSDLNDFTKQ